MAVKKGIVEFMYQDDQPVPYIRLQGKWLRKYGFVQGSSFELEKEPGQLVIRLLRETDDNEVVCFHNMSPEIVENPGKGEDTYETEADDYYFGCQRLRQSERILSEAGVEPF